MIDNLKVKWGIRIDRCPNPVYFDAVCDLENPYCLKYTSNLLSRLPCACDGGAWVRRAGSRLAIWLESARERWVVLDHG
jgi:hypothetical protein